MRQVLQHFFTARDNSTYSLTKIVGFSGAGVLMFQFVHSGSVDFLGYAGGLAAIMAALAAKYHVEGK